MTYKVNRALGYQNWGVTNPWVFADYGQPQRQRGTVSPMVFQTHPPRLMNDHLGQTTTVDEDRSRAVRMEYVAYASLALSAWSLWFFYDRMTHPRPTANKSTRKKRRKGRRS